VHNNPEFSDVLAWRPDGKLMAVGGTNGTVNLWQLHPLHMTASFAAVRGIVVALSFSPDGKSLLVAGNGDPATQPGGGTLRIWRLQPTPRVMLNLHGFWRNLWASYNADGSVVAATGTPADAPGGFAQGGQGDGQVGEWDARTGKLLATPIRLQGHGEADAARFASHGTTVAVAQLGNWAAMVDPAHRKVLRRWQASSEFLLDAALSPDGTRVATVDYDGYLRLWNAASAKPVLPQVRMSQGSANSVVWSPDGTQLLTAGADGTIRFYDSHTGQQLGTSITLPSDSASASYSPDGRTIAIGDLTGRVWLYPATIEGWTAYACQVANRNLTRTEWSKYVPGRAYRKICPAAH
jgi:hypothetical protein